jgi:hypothetical protein
MHTSQQEEEEVLQGSTSNYVATIPGKEGSEGFLDRNSDGSVHEEEEEGVTGRTSSYAATSPRMEGYGRNDNGTANEPHTLERLKSTLRVLFGMIG